MTRPGRRWPSGRAGAALAGALAGLVAGLLTGALLAGQDAMAGSAFGARSAESGFVLYVVASVGLGAGFGLVGRYERDAYAADVSGGLLLGLLGFLLGPLTLVPLATGETVRWSLAEASGAFPQLVAALGFGALTGFGFHVVMTWARAGEPTPNTVRTPVAPWRVVILGGGFGGVGAAQRLEQIFARSAEVEVTLVSSSNYLLFTPMLAEVASSALRAEHISAPIRASCPRTRFRRAEVDHVDLDRRVVRICSAGGRAEDLDYDHLVLALGSVPTFRDLPGLAQHAFALKSLDDATRVRNHVLDLLERADAEPDAATRKQMLTFVVAGGGFAGTEMIAELFDLVRGVLHYYPGVGEDDTRFVLVHSGDRILPELDGGLADYAQERLEARGIEFVLGARLASASPTTVTLADDTEIPAYTLVWTAGNRPSPVLDRLPFERNRAGALVADPSLQVQGHANVWGVGDCAAVPDPAADGAMYPPTAQNALRQGRRVGDNIARASRGDEPTEFRFRSLGTLVALGHRTAVAEIRGLRFSGFAAWFLWRTIYLAKLPGVERKLRVCVDWSMDLLFPRDIVVTSRTPTLPETIADSPAQAAEAVTGS
ncbi:MAG: NAD(P)/FAD-dependent oxidoreductase [Ilumatobacteraceae bacterium]